MRRTLFGMVVAAAIALVPVLAMAGTENQEFAEQIAASLRDSGQLQDYKIGVKFQDGTAWLRGRVTSQDQLNAALRHVLQTPGVLRVVNNLEVAEAEGNAQPAPQTPLALQQTSAAFGTDPLPRRTVAQLSSVTNSRQELAAPSMAETAPRPQAEKVASTQVNKNVRPVAVTTVRPTLARAAKPVTVRPTSRVSTAAAAEPQPISQTVPQMAAPMGAPMVAMGPPTGAPMPMAGGPIPQYVTPASGGMPPAQYDQPTMPNYAWPSYASYPNYAAVSYPKQYSPTAWPYIGPFYPYPQVPLGWRSVKLQWHDGWWQLDFDDGPRNQWFSGLFRPWQ